MKSITFYGEKRSKRGTLHIEAPGCIVNIDVGLTDSEGQAVTRVTVLADNYADDKWHMPDFEIGDEELRHHLGVRVVQLKSE